MKGLSMVKTGISRIMHGQLRCIPYLPLSWIPITIEPHGEVFKARAYNGKIWFIPVDDHAVALWAFRFLERNERFLDVLQEVDYVVEVGACTGEYTIPAAQRIGVQGKIVAFEADASGCECIKKNAQFHNLDNIEIFNKAVSDTSGEKVTLSVPTNISGGMLIETPDGAMRTTTLNECLSQVPVDVLKITVNGHEPHILAGASNLLPGVRAVIIQSAHHEELSHMLEKYSFIEKKSIDAQDSPENVRILLFERK